MWKGPLLGVGDGGGCHCTYRTQQLRSMSLFLFFLHLSLRRRCDHYGVLICDFVNAQNDLASLYFWGYQRKKSPWTSGSLLKQISLFFFFAGSALVQLLHTVRWNITMSYSWEVATVEPDGVRRGAADEDVSCCGLQTVRSFGKSALTCCLCVPLRKAPP